MNRANARRRSQLGLALAGAVVLAGTLTANAQSPHLGIIEPGGMPGSPVVTGVQRETNSITVTWDGPQGYYQLFEEIGLNGTWQAIGKATNISRMAVVPLLPGSAFFKVAGPAPDYAGWQTCAECHSPVLATVAKTPHAAAFTNAIFAAQGGQTNGACLACHTVGYHVPTGFVSKTTTLQLAAVECENCHGPAVNHATNPDDPIAVPRVELAGTVCGGCHNTKFVPAQVTTNHPPFYEEWSASPHSSVVPDVQSEITGPSGTNFISACGRCHSGSVREALTEGQTLPNGREAAAIGIACATCHDPHQVYVHTNLLRGVVVNPFTGIAVTNNQLGAVYTNQIPYPFASTNDFYLTTSGPFTNNLNINVCAQCHNHRGATWQSNSRPPHHSPQYNMLLGTVGELSTGTARYQPGTHAFLENQCVRCHMQNTNSATASQSSGHTFEVTSYNTCLQCHPFPAVLVNVFSNSISSQIQDTKSALDLWASTKAPSALWTKYGTRAWEYTNPGELSSGGPGPNSTEQALIPVTIQKARYNLYLVFNDGSFGVHNPEFAAALLGAAQNWVGAALSQ